MRTIKSSKRQNLTIIIRVIAIIYTCLVSFSLQSSFGPKNIFDQDNINQDIETNNLNQKGTDYERKHNSISPEYLADLAKNANFKVIDYQNHPFRDMSFEELKKLFNIKDIITTDPVDQKTRLYYHEPQHHKHNHKKILHLLEDYKKDQENKLSALPDYFNSKDVWPPCIHPIRNQQQCGGCWAFAATDVLADRLCIASQGVTNVVLSPQDLISCETDQMGCNGGYIERSWSYLINTGAVTSQCFPFTAGSGYVEPCISQCKSPTVIYRKYRATTYRRYQYVNDIKTEIYYYGPVETGFLVYLDFMNYASGIYQKNSDYLLGGHAIKIIGWGVENNIQYWICANSWSVYWGEAGYFRIAINNCCNFEANVVAGYARLIEEEETNNEKLNEIEILKSIAAQRKKGAEEKYNGEDEINLN